MTVPKINVKRLSARVDAGLLRSLIESDTKMQGLARQLEQKFKIPKEKADQFMLAVLASSVDGVGQLKLTKLTKRFATLNELRAQVGNVLDDVLSGKSGQSAQNLQELFGRVKSEIDGLQKDLQTREYGGVVDELSAKLKQDLEGKAPKIGPKHELRAPGRHYEPPGFMKDAYKDLQQNKPELYKAFERALADDEAAAFLQKALEADDSKQAALIAGAKAKMAGKMTPDELANLEAAITDQRFGLGRARRRAMINNRQTLEGRMRQQMLERIDDPELRKAIADSDFQLLPGALDEFGGELPFALDPKKPTDQLLTAWKNFKESEGIPDGKRLTPQQRSGFAQYWRRVYQVEQARPAISERTTVFELARHEDLNILKVPGPNPKDPGTDMVGFKDNGEIWIPDDKAYKSTTTVSRVSAFENLADNILSDSDKMKKAIAKVDAKVARGKMSLPDDANLEQSLAQARRVVDQYEECGKKLKELTKDWDEGDIYKKGNARKFRKILQDYDVHLKVTSALGKVLEVSERLELLDIEVWRPPTK